MSATKILWGQISVVFLIILATTWGATQYVAWSLAYQAQLGPPWFELFGTPIYYPPALFWWWYFYEAYAPPIFAKGGIIAASGGFTRAGARQRAFLYRYCQTGHTFGKVGLAVTEVGVSFKTSEGLAPEHVQTRVTVLLGRMDV